MPLFVPECDLKKVLFSLTHHYFTLKRLTQYLPKDNNGWVGHYEYFLPIHTIERSQDLRNLVARIRGGGTYKTYKASDIDEFRNLWRNLPNSYLNNAFLKQNIYFQSSPATCFINIEPKFNSVNGHIWISAARTRNVFSDLTNRQKKPTQRKYLSSGG